MAVDISNYRVEWTGNFVTVSLPELVVVGTVLDGGSGGTSFDYSQIQDGVPIPQALASMGSDADQTGAGPERLRQLVESKALGIDLLTAKAGIIA